MTISIPWAPPSPAVRVKLQLAMVGVACAAAAAGFAVGSWGGQAAAQQAGPDLVRLMRFMAVLKALLATAAAAAMVWRLGAPVTTARLAAYALALAAMAAGPGLIWGLSNVVVGSILLHGGLLATVILLWRDPGTASWLETLITARRMRRLTGA